jgi:hypothetical protein
MTDRGAPEPSSGAVPGSVVWRSVNDAMNEQRGAMVEKFTGALTPGFGPMTAGLAGMTAATTPGFAGMTAPITPVHAASMTPGFGTMTPRLAGFPGWPRHFGAGVPGIAWPGAKGVIR